MRKNAAEVCCAGSVSAGSRGFTLIEVLIVVLIIGLLAAVVVPQFSSAATDARDSTAAAQARTVELQLELYLVRFGSFPTAALMQADPTDTDLGDAFGVLVDNGFLKSAPVNPYTGGSDIPTDWTYNATDGTVTALTAPAPAE
ncbi:MAG: prepilin-type N-terminal cleavage/methylation domain-containing protein [Planctomycetota bacterium]